jgi:hypothetical protein
VVVSGAAVVVVVASVVFVGTVVSVARVVAVLTTGARVVAVVPDVPDVTGARVAGVVVTSPLVVDGAGWLELVCGMVTRIEVVVGRIVVVGDWVATCCFGELSVPVVTSKSRATRAIEART